MEIILTYEGKIPSKSSSKEAVWDMRRSFDSQLRKLWGKPPFDILQKIEQKVIATGEDDFRITLRWQQFVPLYGEKIGVGVELEIRLLTAQPDRKAVISAGDLDNRVKRIIDALQAPTQVGELLDDMPAGQRWYSLVDNDSAVLALNVRLGAYLGGDSPGTSFAIIIIRPAALRASWNVQYLLT